MQNWNIDLGDAVVILVHVDYKYSREASYHRMVEDPLSTITEEEVL